MIFLRYLYVLALVVWLGGMVVAGGVAAPSIFAVLQEWNPVEGRVLAGRVFGESSRPCFARMALRGSFYGLLGNMAALAERYGVEWLTACPRVEHSAVYQRLYRFRPMAEPRRYFGVSFETELLGIRLDEVRELAKGVRWMGSAWEAAREQS